MPKQQINFVCQECGYDSPAYLGKCPECGQWNTFKEFHESKTKRTDSGSSTRMTGLSQNIKPQALSTVTVSPKNRIPTGFVEMDAVLGGGIVLGSAMLLAGDPGIGKSTLLLQLAMGLYQENKILYLSAEESVEQVAMRAKRLNQPADAKAMAGKQDTKNENLLLLSITDTDQIVETIQEIKPSLVIIDSIQTVESENAGGLSGSVGQVRYAAQSFIRVAKQHNIPVIMVGHVTKEGMVAGPMVLSHMVDTVLFLEGEKMTSTRILRSLKNRFGPVDEVGIFQMEGEGMIEVTNPEQIFLGESQQGAPGSVLVVIMEGTRPFLIEIQALVVYSKFPMPRRVANGIDGRRLELLLAVLQKHCKLPLETYDVFVNVAGGIKVQDRGVDLGVCLAVFSSLKNVQLKKTVGIAEVGLLGELRKVPQLEKRIKEAKKLGFSTIITQGAFSSLSEVLTSFGYSEKQGKKWSQQDERHWTLEEEK